MAFDQESTSSPAAERNHFMSSSAKTSKRSKKTRRLGPMQVPHPDQDEAFDVETKIECIRALIPLDLVAVFLDGKAFADMMMVLAVGITLTGEKHVLGFVETGTENAQVLTRVLQSLGERA